MSQFNNINYLKLDKNLVLESAYTSRAVTSSDKLFHAILENNDTNKANNWVNDRLKTQNLTANDLLFKIAGKDINVPSNISLHLVLDSLIEKGADVHAKNYHGNTPLYWASFNGYLEIAKVLIKKGANVNATNKDSETPLHWATVKGHIEIVKVLIQKGADVHATDKWGDTPLHWALNKGDLEIAKLLKIVNHLDNNDSIDTLTSDIENLTADEIKGYYNENKEQIDSLIYKRTKALIKKAITDLNEDISIAIIKRGKDFIKDLCEVRPLKELCAIELQKHFTKDDDDPYYNDLKTYPDILQKIFFKSYTPLLTLSDEQITCAQNLLKKLNS